MTAPRGLLSLHDLVATSAAVAATRSRKQKIGLLAACLRAAAPDELRAAVAYMAGNLTQGKIGLGYATVHEVFSATGPGTGQATLAEVDAVLSEIAAQRGAGSQAARKQLLGALAAHVGAGEREFLARLIVGELRQGASDGLMIDAIAAAAEVAPARVRRAVMLAGDAGEVAARVRAEGVAALDAFTVQLFRPVLPMLATPIEDPEAVFGLMGEAAFELKLDGARVQIHKAEDEVRVYSRQLNDVTSAVPEVVALARALPARELILDGEAIALASSGAPHPFQTTMRRFGRRTSSEQARAELPLSCFAFDALSVDGQSLIDEPTRRRLEALDALVPAEARVERIITADPDDAETMWRRALELGHEGLMAKALDAPYAAGGRGKSWLKLKPAHTLDLVVLAAEWGSGRRRGWLSNLHLGARDPAGGFVMLGKTFKGMTDQVLAWQTAALLALETGREGHVVQVRPELVVEIAFNDVQESPHYPGGMALRFARLKRYRADKTAADADTVETVRALMK